MMNTSISKQYAEKKIPPIILLFVIILFAIQNVLRVYTVVYPDNYIIASAKTTSYVISDVGLGVELYQEPIARKKKLSLDEYKVLVYSLGITFYLIACQLSNIFSNQYSWSETGEANLSSFIFFQLILTVMISILPGRLARKQYEVSEEMLALKRIFVRYISHEIR